MKKKKISLDSNFWGPADITDPFDLITAFFDFADIHTYKGKLNEMMMFMYNKGIYSPDYPGQIFVFYKALHSFIRAGYCLQFLNKKGRISEPEDSSYRYYHGMLSAEEFADPFLVFKTAFTKQSLTEFDYFLCEITHLSLSPRIDSCGKDLMTPFIYLIKMLEAAQLIRQRGIEKM